MIVHDFKNIIAVDVDLTVCAIDLLWFEWLKKLTGAKKVNLQNYPKPLDYNLGSYFPECEKMGINPIDFYRNEGIYDFAETVPGSVEALTALHENGKEIVFVSHIKGNHHKSKYNFLKRNFPFMSGFVATKEKYLVASKYLIDDRNEHLNRSSANVRIKIETPYTQNESLIQKVHKFKTWKEIQLFILRK